MLLLLLLVTNILDLLDSPVGVLSRSDSYCEILYRCTSSSMEDLSEHT